MQKEHGGQALLVKQDCHKLISRTSHWQLSEAEKVQNFLSYVSHAEVWYLLLASTIVAW